MKKQLCLLTGNPGKTALWVLESVGGSVEAITKLWTHCCRSK